MRKKEVIKKGLKTGAKLVGGIFLLGTSAVIAIYLGDKGKKMARDAKEDMDQMKKTYKNYKENKEYNESFVAYTGIYDDNF